MLYYENIIRTHKEGSVTIKCSAGHYWQRMLPFVGLKMLS